MQPSKGKGLILLRFSKQLIKRLSKVKHVVFCGRILILLASVFPLSDRSGVNLQGEFNLLNNTEYEQDTIMDSPPLESKDPKAKEFVNDIFENDSLYKAIWSTQSYLGQPILLFNTHTFELFKSNIETIHTAFKLFNSQEPKTKSSNSQIITTLQNTQLPPFFPKYLTGKNLFTLETRDASFRNQITLQLLIILNFLSTLSTYEKERDHAYLVAINGKENKNVQYNYTLTTDQEVYVNATRKRLFDLLGVGNGFVDMSHQILTNERNWVYHKNL